MCRWITVAAALSLGLILAPAVRAQAPNREALRQKALERFDKDGDGQLSDAERAAARDAAQEPAGGAKKGKRPAGKARPGGQIPEMVLKRFDQNGNGKLDPDERAAAREAMAQRGRQGFGPAAPEPRDPKINLDRLKSFDADGDGKLSPEERRKALVAARRLQDK